MDENTQRLHCSKNGSSVESCICQRQLRQVLRSDVYFCLANKTRGRTKKSHVCRSIRHTVVITAVRSSRGTSGVTLSHWSCAYFDDRDQQGPMGRSKSRSGRTSYIHGIRYIQIQRKFRKEPIPKSIYFSIFSIHV